MLRWRANVGVKHNKDEHDRPTKKESKPRRLQGLAVRDRYEIPVMLHIFTSSSSLDDDKETNI